MISSKSVVGFHRVLNLKIVKGLRDRQVVPAVFLLLLHFFKKDLSILVFEKDGNIFFSFYLKFKIWDTLNWLSCFEMIAVHRRLSLR